MLTSKLTKFKINDEDYYSKIMNCLFKFEDNNTLSTQSIVDALTNVYDGNRTYNYVCDQLKKYRTIKMSSGLNEEAYTSIFNNYVYLRNAAKEKFGVSINIDTEHKTINIPFVKLKFDSKTGICIEHANENTPISSGLKNIQDAKLGAWNHILRSTQFKDYYSALYFLAVVKYLNEHQLALEFKPYVDNLDVSFLDRNDSLFNELCVMSSLLGINYTFNIEISNPFMLPKQFKHNKLPLISNKVFTVSSSYALLFKNEQQFFYLDHGGYNSKYANLFTDITDTLYIANNVQYFQLVLRDVRYDSKFNYNAIIQNYVKNCLSEYQAFYKILQVFKKQAAIFEKKNIAYILSFNDLNKLYTRKEETCSIYVSNSNMIYAILSMYLEDRIDLTLNVLKDFKHSFIGEYCLEKKSDVMKIDTLSESDWKIFSKLKMNVLNYMFARYRPMFKVEKNSALSVYSCNNSFFKLWYIFKKFNQEKESMSILLLNRLFGDYSQFMLNLLQGMLPSHLEKRVISFILTNYKKAKKLKKVKGFILEIKSLFDHWAHLSNDELNTLFKNKTTFEQFVFLHQQWAVDNALVHGTIKNAEFYEWNGLVPSCKIKNYEIVPLVTGKELIIEGIVMKHCVGSYVTRCINGVSRIFSIKSNGVSIVTFELTKYSTESKFFVRQVQGCQNQRVADEFTKIAKSICAKVNALENIPSLLKEVYLNKKTKKLYTQNIVEDYVF